jgi:hypothetical protein
MTTQLSDEPLPHSVGGLLRLRDAARLANLSEHHFKSGAECGDIPVALLHIGRFDFVRAQELCAWLDPASPVGAPLTSSWMKTKGIC